MSELRDLHEQISNIQKTILKRHIDHLVSITGTREYDDANGDELTFDEEVLDLLKGVLEQNGLNKSNGGYNTYMREFDYDDFADEVSVNWNGQLLEFCRENSGIFSSIAYAVGDYPKAIADLVDINELLQIDSQTLQDIPTNELWKELEEKREAFMKLKLTRGIKAIQDGIELSDDSELSIYGESDMLAEMLSNAGYGRSDSFCTRDYILKKGVTYIRVGDNIIKHDKHTGTLSKEISIQDLEEYFKDDDIDRIIEVERATDIIPPYDTVVRRDFSDEPENSQLLALPQINLQQLGISLETIENQRGGNAVITMEQLRGLIANVPEKEVEKAKVGKDSLMKSWEESQRDGSTRDKN